MLYTAPCPSGHVDAQWSQLPAIDGAAPYRYDITCGPCTSRTLATTLPHPAALPPATPLVLRGYRWVRAAVLA